MSSASDSIRFSVVTVCFNEEKRIAETIESVLNQDYDNFELIIQNGASTDNTLLIAKQYQKIFESKNIRYVINSLKDEGTYDAMNKSILSVTGEKVIFLNAGDLFFDNTVLKRVSLVAGNADIVYGDVIIKYSFPLYKKIKAKEISTIKDSMPFCHQSVFVATPIIKEIGFDTTYKITADYNFFLECYEKEYSFFKLEIPISVYDGEGISSTDRYNYEYEIGRCKYRHQIIGEDEYRDLLRTNEVCKKKRKRRDWLVRMIPTALYLRYKRHRIRKLLLSQGYVYSIEKVKSFDNY